MAEPDVEQAKLADIRFDAGNANRGTERGRYVIESSMREFGFADAGTLDKHNTIIGGNKRTEIAGEIGMDGAIIVDVDGTQPVFIRRRDLDLADPDDDRARRLAYALNRSQQVSLDWDAEQLLADIQAGTDLSGLFFADELNALLLGLDGDPGAAEPGAATEPQPVRASLAERFVVPPFSVLDARQGYWQQRKRAWIELGIRGELGRDSGIVPNGGNRPPEHDGAWLRSGKPNPVPGGGSPMPHDRTANGKTAGRTFAQDLMRGEHVVGAQRPADSRAYHDHDWQLKHLARPQARINHIAINTQDWVQRKIEDGEIGPGGANVNQSGTSVFDPVLCEIAYRWFAPQRAAILDPFAGEATKGIVAAYLGHAYTGVELRAEQVAANVEQANAIGVAPQWICGDSERIGELLPAGARYDLIFTSPPYFDLEIYSADTRDGSAFSSYERFMGWYRDVFAQCVERLNPNRFVVVKIGEIRDRKTGAYRNFVGDTIRCFTDLGLHYYNEMILITVAGSLPIRVAKQFETTRKIGKTHQNVLAFFRGDLRAIKQEFPQEFEYGTADIPGQTDPGGGH